MGLTPTATEAEIRKAYRKLSLALHPDKNRGVEPEVAAARFNEMQLAYEILMDPAARLAAAERNKAEEARKERRGAYDGKRKEMAEELEKREEEERLKRFKGAQDEHKRRETLEKLREEGKRLREEKERKMKEAVEESRNQQQLQQEQSEKENGRGEQDTAAYPSLGGEEAPSLGPLDLSVRLRFPKDQFAQLLTTNDSSSSSLDTPLARGLEARFGKLDSLVWKVPKSEKKKASTEMTAHATFKTLDSAFAAVKIGSQLRAGQPGAAEVLEDVWIGWAAGSRGDSEKADGSMSGEPSRITWLRKQNNLFSLDPPSSSSEDSRAAPLDQMSEDNILLKMKQGASAGEAERAQKGSSPASTLGPSDGYEQDVVRESAQASKPVLIDAEASILERMRQSERARMEEAIRYMESQ